MTHYSTSSRSGAAAFLRAGNAAQAWQPDGVTGSRTICKTGKPPATSLRSKVLALGRHLRPATAVASVLLATILCAQVAWTPLGPYETNWPSASGAAYTCLALDASGHPFVAYADAAQNSRATVERWDGSSWQVVGAPGFTGDYATDLSLKIDASGHPVLAYHDEHNGIVQRWNGSSWQLDGGVAFAGWQSLYNSLALSSPSTNKTKVRQESISVA